MEFVHVLSRVPVVMLPAACTSGSHCPRGRPPARRRNGGMALGAEESALFEDIVANAFPRIRLRSLCWRLWVTALVRLRDAAVAGPWSPDAPAVPWNEIPHVDCPW